jgi:Icc-related predicted phosphoesterase
VVRYLVASDLHYALRQLDWIADEAPGFDAVVLAGDLLDAAGGADLTAQIALFTAYLRRLGERTTVVVNSGNHDLTARRADGEKAALWLHAIDGGVVTDGQAVRVGDDVVSSCAWWEGDATRAELEAQLARDAEMDRDGLWIWAYHSPPEHSPTAWSGKRHWGDDVLNRLIELHRPDLVLAGHVHEAPLADGGSWHDRIGSTTILNAGRQLGPIPAHIIVDSGERTAEWWCSEGRGRIAV